MKFEIELEKITPEILANAFWNLSASQQAEFFEHLHDVTVLDGAYGNGELQWCYMGQEINKSTKAKEQACSMLAWVFNHATDFLDKRF
jgi:hypothetical protein